MKIFVISLMRSVERRASVTRQFAAAGLAFEFIDGVDGQALTPAYIEQNVNQERYKYWHELRHPGAIGCALSHRAAYLRMVAEDIPVAAVLEDDIVLSPHFAQVLPQLVAQVREREVMLLFFHSSLPVGLSRTGGAKLPHEYELLTIQKFEFFGSAAGYVLPLSTAAALAAVQQPVYTIADDWAQFQKQGGVDSFRLVVPFLLEPAGFKSTIGYVDTNSLGGRLAGWIDKHQVFPFEQVLRFMRKRSSRKRQLYTIESS
jgi:glycosyl transferase family 25